ncbi:DNA (cytosine-5)-methyltransferase 1 [Microbacterium halimionae]|uniref:Cytosine-specific methyltransferase n=1 Tax=Microbacterium halimionae TaxID=1526413 RepID=A0A7W3PL14_9MICO|nr:DNA mismatch endonuclease Vsr [Microbacterium halimionae]MBA8815683.1 DNA (cytosine-5)-methyltransferase 1 [Microbacterium halimionae]NII95729.1 DNA (cytosine-5)-methyltransferase 1 [Microbacterium halimionae]
MTMVELDPSQRPHEAVESLQALRVVSLFSGIGGFDLGLQRAGHEVVEMCESWEPARRVLAAQFPDIHVDEDVQFYSPTVEFDLLTAGFPCVDLSHAGSQRGIFGAQSGLVEHVFRIAAQSRPNWILLENVPNLLKLQKGAGIRYIIESLERLGYSWAYRVLDSRAFGVAQRRNRVIVLASLTGNPRDVLLNQDTSKQDQPPEHVDADASGFYWTEGRRGVGLVIGAVPTLKGGSTLGLPSAPAIWLPKAPQGQRIVLPSIEDAEELQGFDRGWTKEADTDQKRSYRWKVVGNAVTVGLAEWLGARLSSASIGEPNELRSRVPHNLVKPWPDAAFGANGEVWRSTASRMPIVDAGRALVDVVDPTKTTPLSFRATKGFLSRIEESGIVIPDRFMKDLESHMARLRESVNVRTPQDPELPDGSGATSASVRKRMQANRPKNTTPERKLRRALADRGMRYRLQARPEQDMRWRSDIIFRGAKVVVDVRGCFWHVCPIHQTRPKANAERWAEKLERNRLRDLRMESELMARGWMVITVWEHDDAVVAAVEIETAVRARRTTKRPTVKVDANRDGEEQFVRAG